jgi:hypothetical protein
MERAATGQAALCHPSPTAAPACAARPGKCHSLTPRGTSCGTSCDTPAAAPAAATRSATLTCTGRVA